MGVGGLFHFCRWLQEEQPRVAEDFLLFLWRAGAQPSLGTGSADGGGVVDATPSNHSPQCLASR